MPWSADSSDSIGRPDVNAKFSIAELFIYVPTLVGLLHLFGIQGAAVAWTARVGIDLCVRVVIASRLSPTMRPVLGRMLGVVWLATLLIALPLLARTAFDRAAVVLLAASLYALALWVWGVTEGERAFWSMRLGLRPTL